MTRARCIGAFADGKLVGYNWIGVDGVPTPSSGRQWLFMLDAGEACLFDMYVVPAHRGQRLAAILRGKVQRMLRDGGFKKFYSVTLAFNRASRRFKARLGAREVELRWYLHLRIGRLPGFDLRLWRRQPYTPSPWIKLDEVPLPDLQAQQAPQAIQIATRVRRVGRPRAKGFNVGGRNEVALAHDSWAQERIGHLVERAAQG
jgi:GNAT superfamily N-acetyltransferase